MEAIQTLRGCGLLKSFTDVGVKILASIAQPRTFGPGEAIFRQGEDSDAMWVIGAGQASIILEREEGEPQEIGQVGPGDVIGELALIAGGKRMVSVITDGPLQAVRITRLELNGLQRKKPQACLKLLMVISKQLGKRVAEDGEIFRRIITAALPD
ncbi:MAG: cyclic nucleotide-binding domain-containing protein [Deltaproteobacteria bacterium]|nr:cyclic nucleotide-binding domain-containing protein [Deltaproteobacteria bacterium]